MSQILEMSIADFRKAIAAQEVPTVHKAFRCPRCQAIQSADDLIRAGAGKTFEEVERFIGFSCVGRWTGAGSPRKEPDGKPCNWTLGGLFRMHELEVITVDGEHHPHFMPAAPSDALTHMQTKELQAGAA